MPLTDATPVHNVGPVYRQIPRFLKTIGSIFLEAGFSVYLVGGAVRNIVGGIKPVDYDLATDAGPEEVMKLFRRVIPTGIKHGTVTVLFKDQAVEVTTFRIDGTYSNRRHPDSVSFTPSIEKDLERRDFTINSLALNLNTGEILDPHGGRGDLERGIIRAIGEPVERFSEDGLRLLRACRFAAQLDFQIEKRTLEGMRETHANLSHVSVERIRTELEKILATLEPSKAFFIMEETGIMETVLPELSATRGIGSKGPEGYDVFTHSLKSCDGAPPGNLPVRLAALLHDIGKPETRIVTPGGCECYHGHEKESEKLARGILRRFRFPKVIETRTLHLIVNHMFDYSPDWSEAAVRRFLHRTGAEYIDDLFLLRLADHFGMNGYSGPRQYLTEFRRRIDAVLTSSCALTLKDLAVDGNDLHEKAGIPRGPVMGDILEALLETVLDDPAQNTPETLLLIAGNLHEKIK